MKFNEFINNFKYTGNGVGKNTSINDVDKYQLIVGIAVELEHTDDLNVSASIAIDHLTENEKYYTILLNSGLVDEEKAMFLGQKYLNVDSAQQNAAMNAEENQDGMPGELDKNGDSIPAIEPDFDDNKDKQMTDMLLGFEPKNVGDEVENDEIQEDSSTSTLPQDQQKYLEYRKAGFDNLDDNQREELFNLWKKFRSIK